MAGVFSPLGKFAVAVAFVISNRHASLQVNSTSQVFYGAVEVAAASILYMLLPQSRRLSNLFTAHGDRLPGDSLRKNVIFAPAVYGGSHAQRIGFRRSHLGKLETTAAADLPHVYGRAAEKVCTGCSQCAVCWRKNRDETQKTFSRLSYPLRERGKIERSDFDVPFLTRCNRAMELRDAVNGEYRELLAKESARMARRTGARHRRRTFPLHGADARRHGGGIRAVPAL